MRERGRYTKIQGQQISSELERQIGDDSSSADMLQKDLDRTIMRAPLTRKERAQDPTEFPNEDAVRRQLRRVRDEDDRT